MLEQHVVFESHSAKTSKDAIAHEVVRVGSEAVNDIVVVPDVDHWDLAVGHTEQALREPHSVAVEVELFQLFLHLFAKVGSVLTFRVLDLKPVAE